MATDPESWDSDPDFALPSGPLSLPLPSVSAGLSSAAPSPLPSPSSAREPERGFFDDLDAQLAAGATTSKTREDENESSVDSSRSSTTTGTLMGLMEGLSLDHDEGDITLSFNGPPSPAAPPEIVNTAATPRTKQQGSRMTTLRPGSSLSQLLSTSISGKVHHLGSTPRGAAKEVGEGDWDQDLDFEGIDALGLSAGDLPEGGQRVGKKGSWTSHISVEDDEDEPALPPSLAFPSTSSARPLKKQISIASFKDDVDDISDADFDLPSSRATFEISPALTLNRPSMSSLRSVSSAPEEPQALEGSSSSTPAPRTPTTPATLPPPSSRLSTASPALSTGTDLTVLTDSDSPLGASSSPIEDLDFFEDLELPPYFLGGGGRHKTLTPPTSEGEPDTFLDASSPDKRVDLQAVLRAKLEQRGGRGLLFGPAPGSPTPAASVEQQDGLLKHREEAADEFDVGKELSLSKRDRHQEGEEENWTAEEMRERMRTISGARAREAAVAKAAGRGGMGGRGGMRRTMSEGKVPKRIGHHGRSSTNSSVASVGSATSAGTVKAGLSRNGSGASPVPASSSSSGNTARSSLPQPTRPASAQGAAPSSSSSTSTRRAGPPPAPSTASRDRVRLRTISLRTVGSSSDLRTPTSTAAGRRPPKLNLDVGSPAGEKGKGRSLSPVPLTPATPALRTKRSQQHLGPSPPSSSSRTLERKRSLQNLSSHIPQLPPPPPSSSRPSSRQHLRSPSPASRPSFAAPTAASSSRVRERVQSNPHPPAIVPPSPNLSATRAGGTGRLLQPTLSSASKTRSPSKPSLASVPRMPSAQTTPHPHLAGLRLPSHSLHLSRPLAKSPSKRELVEYGDGTELDGFDDLPVSKERERRSVSRASSAGKGRTVSGGSTASTVKGGSWGKASGASAKKGKDEGKGKSLKPTASATVGRKEAAVEKGKEKEKQQQQGKKKRREPHLIRHLGASATKVQGEMTYNPQLQRWEGNESILREFDKVLSTSVRPALISPFSSTLGSPARQSFPSAGSASSGSLSSLTLDPTPPATAPAKTLPAAAAPRGAAKVVGDMVFDPATCSWHALAGADAEDELEFDLVDWGSAGEFADDEDGDGWAAGERERMLKNRASFVLSEGEEDEDEGEEEEGGTGGGRAKQTRRGIWRESKRAEERCRAEMRGWVQSPRRREEGEVEDRAWLFELRALIMDSR
ncbi:hypothetical protein JCM5296_002624 [Sporobolomyces johnsonii]